MSKKRSLPSSSRGEQPPQKVRKVITNDQVALAKIFESLASDTQEVRLEAALDIVQICKNNNGEGTEPSFESARPICLRLVRGLCSSRKSARHGFFIAFVEVLRLFKSSPDLKQDCLRIIDEQTSPEDGANNRVCPTSAPATRGLIWLRRNVIISLGTWQHTPRSFTLGYSSTAQPPNCHDLLRF